jgi:hypothetical protein
MESHSLRPPTLWLGAAAVGVAPAQLPSPAVTGIVIPAVGVVPAVAIVMEAGVATTMAAGAVIIMAATTVAAEGITPQGSVRAVTLPGTRLESIIPNTNLPGLVLGTGFRSLTLIYLRPPQTIVNWRIA